MSLEMNGSVSASRATLMIEYEINVSPSPGQSGPIRVPLGMKEGAYRPEGDKGEPNFNADGPGEVVLDVDPETGGYAVLIYPSASPRSGGTPDRETPPPAEESAADEPAEAEGETAGEGDGGSPGEPAEIEETAPDEPSAAAIQIYTVRLALIFPVTQTAGSDESLLLLTPPPAVSSRARILVPLPDVEISTSEGVIASSPVHVSENASELSVFGFNRSGTATAIRWGVDAGAVGMVRELAERIGRTIGVERVILTGGDAGFFARAFPDWEVAPPDFTLQGVRLAAGG